MLEYTNTTPFPLSIHLSIVLNFALYSPTLDGAKNRVFVLYLNWSSLVFWNVSEKPLPSGNTHMSRGSLMAFSVSGSTMSAWFFDMTLAVSVSCDRGSTTISAGGGSRNGNVNGFSPRTYDTYDSHSVRNSASRASSKNSPDALKKLLIFKVSFPACFFSFHKNMLK